jgi:hypothetical protein
MKRRTPVLRVVLVVFILAIIGLVILLLITDFDSAFEDISADLEGGDEQAIVESTATPLPSPSPFPSDTIIAAPQQTQAASTPNVALTASSEAGGERTEQPGATAGTSIPPTSTPLPPSVTPEIEISGNDGELPTPAISNIPTQVAVVVRDDETGQIIGDGNLRVFAPDEVTYPETALVELEMRFRSQYITPTPFGLEITRLPVITATPIPGRPTPTEAVPIYEELNVQFYDLMGATLFCLDLSFEGCDSMPNGEIDAENARPVALQGTNWRWILAPNSAAQGIQNLDVRLWTVDDQQRVTEVWNHAFSIEVNPAPVAAGENESANRWLAILAIALSVIAVTSIMGFVSWQHFRKRRQPRIFISYRRQDSGGSAGRLYDRLRERFGDDTIFRDVDTIGFGSDFLKDIHDAIEQSDVVIVVIGNKWLSVNDEKGNLRIHDPDDFVRLELATALSKNKRVIPALVDEADMPDAEILPEDLRALAFRNAVHIRNDSFDDDVNRLLRQLREDK